jgi:hypothetical protein
LHFRPDAARCAQELADFNLKMSRAAERVRHVDNDAIRIATTPKREVFRHLPGELMSFVFSLMTPMLARAGRTRRQPGLQRACIARWPCGRFRQRQVAGSARIGDRRVAAGALMSRRYNASALRGLRAGRFHLRNRFTTVAQLLAEIHPPAQALFDRAPRACIDDR